jgi:hypothetical protein
MVQTVYDLVTSSNLGTMKIKAPDNPTANVKTLADDR